MENLDLGKKINELRKKRGLSLRGLSLKCSNTTHTTIDRIEKGEVKPLMSSIEDIATALNVNVDFLLNSNNSLPNKQIVKIPVYGSIPAGIPTEMIDSSFIEDYEEINEELLKGGNKYFGLKVNGDSMYPEFRNGDTLILKKQDDCENGDFCAVSINHTESTFKKVLKRDNGITLQPLNPIYEPMFFTNKEVEELPITILGVIKEVRRSY